MHLNDALDEISADEETPSAPESTEGLDEVPGTDKTVDELEGELTGLQDAMDQVQRGDLDAAEASIATLENASVSGDDAE